MTEKKWEVELGKDSKGRLWLELFEEETCFLRVKDGVMSAFDPGDGSVIFSDFIKNQEDCVGYWLGNIPRFWPVDPLLIAERLRVLSKEGSERIQ